MAALRHPSFRRPLVSLLPAAALALRLVSPAAAQIHPPAPGVDLPPVYFERVHEDRTAFQFKRAWFGETRRVQENVRRRDAGLLPVSSSGGGFVVSGTKYVPVIAGKFANTGADPYNVADLQEHLFDGPNPTGTIPQFYNEISYGNITMVGTVFGTGSGGLIQVSQNDTYYEAGCNGLCGTAKTGEYLKELLDASDGSVDFGLFDNDGPDGLPNSGDDDGYADFVAFVQPERGGECGTSNLWSHRWVYEGWWNAPYTTNDAAYGGGFIKVSDYTIQPLKSCNNVDIIEIGVFAHEFGHAFGLPDLYDTDSSNGSSSGIGQWGLMGSGSYGGDGGHPQTPTHMCAWSKEQLGWVQPMQVCGDTTGLSLADVESSGEVYKIYPHGIVDTEYFLIENRVKTGYDTWLPTSGLCIWHIDNDQPGNADETHKLVDLEEADGLAQLDANVNRGDSGDAYPGSTNNTTFNDASNPNSRDYTGAGTQLAVTGINGAVNPRGFDLAVWDCRLRVSNVTVDDGPCGNNNASLDGMERANLQLCVLNELLDTQTNVYGILHAVSPGITVLRDSVFYGSTACGVEECGTDEYEIQSTTALASGTILNLQLELFGDGYYSTYDFSIAAGEYVLLVQDDGSANHLSFFTSAITGAGRAYVHHDNGAQGTPTLGELQAAQAVVWYTGQEYDNTFTPAEQAVVSAYLDGGGSLLVTGQDIGYDLAGEGRPADRDFYADYLHAVFVADDSGDNTLAGVAGDPIGSGLSLNLASSIGAMNSDYPSIISAGPGASYVFRYSPAVYGAVRYSTGQRLVYFAFNLEAAAPSEQTATMTAVLNWLITGDQTPPTVTATGPAAGSYSNCDPISITWTASDNVGLDHFDLDYSTDGGASYLPIVGGLPGGQTSYAWDASGITGTGVLVKVKGRDAVELQGVDATDPFDILADATPPVVAVVSPNGGEDFILGGGITFSWTDGDSCSSVDSCRVWVSLNGGNTWSYLATVTGADSLAWSGDSTITDSALVRVDCWDSLGNLGTDQSDSLWSITSSILGAGDRFAGVTHPALLQNHPNPFRASTRFSFYLPDPTPLSLRVYDLSGRLVRTLVEDALPAGVYEQGWNGNTDDGRTAAGGIYFFVLQTPDERVVRKLVKTE